MNFTALVPRDWSLSCLSLHCFKSPFPSSPFILLLRRVQEHKSPWLLFLMRLLPLQLANLIAGR